nr:reverse transcriptase domain-containing protein [Tanacetum cinerariifolium]
MIPTTTPLLGFSGEISWPLGQISLMVTLGNEGHSASVLMNFMVVRSPLPYNGFIGCPVLRKIQAVPCTTHRMLKFPVEGGIATISNTIIIPAECRMVTKTQSTFSPREPAAAEGIKIAIHLEYLKQTITIGESLSEKGRMELCNLLKENLDIFDMTSVPRSIAEHQLNVHTRSGKSISKHEEMYSGIAIGNHTETGEELSRLASPRDKLQFNGKSGFSISARYRKAEEVFPSTSGSGSPKPVHKIDHVTIRKHWDNVKMEI